MLKLFRSSKRALWRRLFQALPANNKNAAQASGDIAFGGKYINAAIGYASIHKRRLCAK